MVLDAAGRLRDRQDWRKVADDLVTRAGRGGSVLQVLESDRAAVAEATPDEVRDALVERLPRP